MSSVPEVLAALATLGTATLTGSPTAQVINGPLGSVTTTQGRLLLIGDQDFEIQEEFDSLGGVTTTEHYVVPCSLTADLPTPDQYVADAQAWADYEALKLALAASPQLGLSASFSLQAAFVGPQMTRRAATSKGRHAAIRFGIDTFAASA